MLEDNGLWGGQIYTTQNIFLINSLAISKDYTNFAGMMSTAIYNKGGKIQGDVAFLASFYIWPFHWKNYTHTHNADVSKPRFFLRAREKNSLHSPQRRSIVVPVRKQQINKYIHQTSPVLISLSNHFLLPLERNRERGF